MIPRLNKAEMWMEDLTKKVVSHKKIEVEVWSTVGLSLHKDEKFIKQWVISHHKSGRRVLKDIPTRKMAIEYMIRLRKVADWNMSLQELMKDRARLEKQVKAMQKEIV